MEAFELVNWCFLISCSNFLYQQAEDGETTTTIAEINYSVGRILINALQKSGIRDHVLECACNLPAQHILVGEV